MQEWIAARLRPYSASIFDTIGQKVRAASDCVNLGQGFPDFDGPDLVKEAAIEAIRKGQNQYAPLPGVPALTSAIREKYLEETGIDFDPATEITVLAGATESMYAALASIVEPGDEFIVFAPVYDTYIPIIEICGAKAVAVPLEAPNFRFDPERLRAAFGPKTRGIIVNTPHNPTGTVFNRAELELIRDLCIEHDCIAITDEVYEYLVFDGHEHISLVTLDGMRDRTITISSTAKSFSMTGWKIGWTIAPPQATTAIRRLHQFIAFAIATPFQHGMAAGIRARNELIPPLVSDLKNKRDLLCNELEKAGMNPYRSEGTFFVIADFSTLSDRPDVDYVLDLIQSEASIATIPISVFYPDQQNAPFNYIRFCFAKTDAMLNRGLERIHLIQ